MRWRIVHLIMEADDFGFVRLSNGCVEVQAMFYADVRERRAVLRRLDIQDDGPNVLGWAALRDLARQAMEALDVDELRIEGAVRTSGAGPGRRPAPLVFRRAS